MSDRGPRLVLLADDYQDTRELYSESLRLYGYRVVEAANGLEAFEKAVELTPDVMVIDLAMPVMDGWETTRRLKADPRTQAIPIVVLTGYSVDGFATRARDAGCDVVATKPCLPPDLLRLIEQVLDH